MQTCLEGAKWKRCKILGEKKQLEDAWHFLKVVCLTQINMLLKEIKQQLQRNGLC